MMKVIYGGRQSGKTTRLINFMRENSKYKMITFSRHRAEQLETKYPDLAGRFISVTSFRKQLDRDVVIDDLDMVLHSIFDKMPAVVTFTPTFLLKPEKLAPNKNFWTGYVDQDLFPDE